MEKVTIETPEGTMEVHNKKQIEMFKAAYRLAKAGSEFIFKIEANPDIENQIEVE